ncbi:MAG: sulfatase [Bacteroidota bacterium]
MIRFTKNYCRVITFGLTAFFYLVIYPTKAEDRPNFIVIMADDCTYRDLQVYGGQAQTPNLVSLASEGMKFTRCFQATAMCAPTRQNLLTGLYPVKNGAYANHSHVYPHVKSIIHHLQPIGYRMALTGKRHIGPEEVYPFQFSDNTADPDMEFISQFISESEQAKQPFGLYAMCSSPHTPWTYGDTSQYPIESIQLPPYLVDTEETRRAYAKYLAEITYFDDQVGQILQLIDQHQVRENTIVIVLSEQGSLFPFEKWTCYDAGLRSALIARYPNVVPACTKTDAMVEYVDILPTLLDFAQTDPEAELDGKSFKQVLLGQQQKHKDYVFGIQTTLGVNNATQGYGIRSVRNDSLKFIVNLFPENQFENALTMNPEEWSAHRKSYLWWIRSWQEKATEDHRAWALWERYQRRPPVELYHIKDDPHELVNLAYEPAYQEAIDLLSKELSTWMQSQGDKGRETELEIAIREN